MDDVMAALMRLPLLFAAIESVFPPVPADTVAALRSWLVARGERTVIGVFLATWVGHVAGAAAMIALGRRRGASWLRRRFPALVIGGGDDRLQELYAGRAMSALFVSRLVPSVCALVPPFSGTVHMPAGQPVGTIAVASAVWYGILSYLVFNTAAEWATLHRLVTRSGSVVAAGAINLLVVADCLWWWRRRRAVR